MEGGAEEVMFFFGMRWDFMGSNATCFLLFELLGVWGFGDCRIVE